MSDTVRLRLVLAVPGLRMPYERDNVGGIGSWAGGARSSK